MSIKAADKLLSRDAQVGKAGAQGMDKPPNRKDRREAGWVGGRTAGAKVESVRRHTADATHIAAPGRRTCRAVRRGEGEEVAPHIMVGSGEDERHTQPR